MANTILIGTDLRNVNLTNAVLTNADLSNTLLHGVDLTTATTDGIILTNADYVTELPINNSSEIDIEFDLLGDDLSGQIFRGASLSG